jgi:hypothetical protein
MIYEILDDSGEVVNRIVADQVFVDANYPNRYREVPEPDAPELLLEKTEEQKIADAVAAAVAKLIADGVLKQT